MNEFNYNDERDKVAPLQGWINSVGFVLGMGLLFSAALLAWVYLKIKR